MTNAQKIIAAIETVRELIKTAGEVPSGHLYAMLMPHGMTLDAYNKIIGILKAGGMVREEQSHMLVYTGPQN